MAKKNTNQNNSKKQKSSTQTTLKLKYEITYLIIGLIIFFISLLSLFDGGFVGNLFANSFRLLIGETYTLFLLSAILWATYLILKGHLPKIRWWRYLGAFLILVSLTTVLHFNLFNSVEPSAIFRLTYERFQNDFLVSQNRTDLGGGFLGAAFYSTLGYLFGRWGTYLFSGILFIIGFCLVENISFEMLKQFFHNTFVGIRNIFKKLFPNFEEIKDVFNDQAMDVAILQEDDPNMIEPINSDEKMSDTMVTDKKPSLFNRLFKDKPVANQTDDLYQTAYKPTYQHAGTREFKPYDLEKEPVVNRIVREEKVLDLDYFDYNHNLRKQPKEHNQPAKPNPIKPIIISSNQAIQNESEAYQDTITKEEYSVQEEIPTTKETTEDLQNIEGVERPSQRMSSAGHWQNQAASTQDLTTDEIEKVLDSAEIAEPKANKKPAQVKKGKKLTLPGKNLLKKIPPVDQSEEYERINENIEKLERTFESFGVKAKVVQANLGPSVTKYEIEPAVGVKVSKIVSLSDDIALALAARDIRMEAPIPGKSLIGIEVPNTQVSPVSFWEIIDAALESKNLLEVPLGRDISGSVCLADLSKMPHLLIAGATGSGKSVGMNVIIVSLLMKAQPDEVKFLMIDPKKVELTLYDDLPHQLTPVVTNPRKAAQALNKVVQEMERRYELFAASNVRNIDSYNEQVDDWNKEQRETVYEKLPKIIVFVDELADLMMVASNEVENAIIRLAQMARAAGIHMIIATQRPSVDVITGIIKANVPSRLAFAVSSGTDSRTILDSNGAEKLLGRGDMLFQPMGKNKPVRVQGAYISDTEVERITDFIKDQQKADYEDSLIDLDEESESSLGVSEDEYFEEAVAMLEGLETISISQLQRKFRIGYNRAARLVDDMEAAGLVAPQDGSKPRQVL